mmetsp:Transcript_22575/g.89330  ORF Transcript_22575/g.89330 Transcript_22575/m.89330 type:complete len:320 (+) Transcript_22575:493-1452(+)
MRGGVAADRKAGRHEAADARVLCAGAAEDRGIQREAGGAEVVAGDGTGVEQEAADLAVAQRRHRRGAAREAADDAVGQAAEHAGGGGLGRRHRREGDAGAEARRQPAGRDLGEVAGGVGHAIVVRVGTAAPAVGAHRGRERRTGLAEDRIGGGAAGRVGRAGQRQARHGEGEGPHGQVAQAAADGGAGIDARVVVEVEGVFADVGGEQVQAGDAAGEAQREVVAAGPGGGHAEVGGADRGAGGGPGAAVVGAPELEVAAAAEVAGHAAAAGGGILLDQRDLQIMRPAGDDDVAARHQVVQILGPHEGVVAEVDRGRGAA